MFECAVPEFPPHLLVVSNYYRPTLPLTSFFRFRCVRGSGAEIASQEVEEGLLLEWMNRLSGGN